LRWRRVAQTDLRASLMNTDDDNVARLAREFLTLSPEQQVRYFEILSLQPSFRLTQKQRLLQQRNARLINYRKDFHSTLGGKPAARIIAAELEQYSKREWLNDRKIAQLPDTMPAKRRALFSIARLGKAVGYSSLRIIFTKKRDNN
jgi:sulfur relay (sulfurtransferase) DsrC/TusE family protein